MFNVEEKQKMEYNLSWDLPIGILEKEFNRLKKEGFSDKEANQRLLEYKKSDVCFNCRELKRHCVCKPYPW